MIAWVGVKLTGCPFDQAEGADIQGAARHVLEDKSFLQLATGLALLLRAAPASAQEDEALKPASKLNTSSMMKQCTNTQGRVSVVPLFPQAAGPHCKWTSSGTRNFPGTCQVSGHGPSSVEGASGQDKAEGSAGKWMAPPALSVHGGGLVFLELKYFFCALVVPGLETDGKCSKLQRIA